MGNDANLREIYDGAIEAMREVRRPLLKPYPDVVETLQCLEGQRLSARGIHRVDGLLLGLSPAPDRARCGD